VAFNKRPEVKYGCSCDGYGQRPKSKLIDNTTRKATNETRLKSAIHKTNR